MMAVSPSRTTVWSSAITILLPLVEARFVLVSDYERLTGEPEVMPPARLLGYVRISLKPVRSPRSKNLRVARGREVTKPVQRWQRPCSMSPSGQRERMRSMRAFLTEFNVYRWAGRMLVDAARVRRRER
jgi:hypothetical protein